MKRKYILLMEDEKWNCYYFSSTCNPVCCCALQFCIRLYGLAGADEHQASDRAETMQRGLDAQRRAACKSLLNFHWPHLIVLFHHSFGSLCVGAFRLKLTWGRSAGTTLCLPARSLDSRHQRAIHPWSSSVATSSPEMPSTNWLMLGSKSAIVG